MTGMLALRYVAVLTMVIWIGGILALGAIAAPSLFDVLAAQPDSGRLLAGALFGEILRRFHLVAYGAGVLLLGTLVLRRVLGPAPRRFAWRLGIATVMVAASAYSGLVVGSRIARLQSAIGAAPSSLPVDDPRRVEFGRLHGLSTALERGICGAAATEKATIIVDDVNADPRYLACSIETKSEIVVPIMNGPQVLGEIDIDSDRPAAFGASDRELLEQVAPLLAEALADS